MIKKNAESNRNLKQIFGMFMDRAAVREQARMDKFYQDVEASEAKKGHIMAVRHSHKLRTW